MRRLLKLLAQPTAVAAATFVLIECQRPIWIVNEQLEPIANMLKTVILQAAKDAILLVIQRLIL